MYTINRYINIVFVMILSQETRSSITKHVSQTVHQMCVVVLNTKETTNKTNISLEPFKIESLDASGFSYLV